MKINKIFVLCITIVTILVWGVNISLFYSKRLENPIFFKNYIDPDGNMYINYLDNDYNEDYIVSISFPEINEERFYVNNHNIMNNNGYILRESILDNNFINDLLVKEESDVNVTKIKYYTNEGATNIVNIGEINFSKPILYDKKYLILKENLSYTQNYTSTISFIAKDTVKLEEYTSKYKEFILDNYYIYINDEPIQNISYPIEFKRDENIKLSYKKKYENSDSVGFGIMYNMFIAFKFVDPEGTIDYKKLYFTNQNSDYSKYMNKKSIDKLKEGRIL
ncbi:hypothetical protein K4H41_07250 [Clostridium chauvoei]|uniref:hypothetical protein n=1 Tax=Clostridium chauvoei TaxID=46867 RepID=UPI001C86433A|nr:hypothetical protein [Clostridium chauvoei]MBX7310986.1 hypothetical protein [Clostridium chauvoei]